MRSEATHAGVLRSPSKVDMLNRLEDNFHLASLELGPLQQATFGRDGGAPPVPSPKCAELHLLRLPLPAALPLLHTNALTARACVQVKERRRELQAHEQQVEFE